MNTKTEVLEGHFLINSPEIQRHRGWFLFLGVLMILVGLAALVFPFAATLASELALGALLLIAGIFGTIHAFRVKPWKGFGWSLLTALLTLLIGVLLLIFPMQGIITVTLLVTILFLASGIFRTILALQLRPYDAWGWILASGILALVLGVLVLTQLPEAAYWLIGLLVGIDFLFTGWSMITLTMALPRQLSSYD